MICRRALLGLLLLGACAAAEERAPRTILLDPSFESGSWALAPTARATLNELARALGDPALAERPVRVRVAPGQDESVGLAHLRAAAVVDQLVQRGLSRSRFEYGALAADALGPRLEVTVH